MKDGWKENNDIRLEIKRSQEKLYLLLLIELDELINNHLKEIGRKRDDINTDPKK